MPIQELVVRFDDDIWQVRFGDRLLSGQPTQMAAVNVAHTISDAAAAKGMRRRSRLSTATAKSLL